MRRNRLAAVAFALSAFAALADGVSFNPDWKGEVDELWFEACQVKHSRAAVDWMRFE